MKYELIPITALRPSPTNPRKHFDEDRIAELAESIKSVGLLEPILCVAHEDCFEIVAGECRFRAAAAAGIKHLPCVVREMTPAEVISAQMAENIARSSLNPMEEADGLAAMMAVGKFDEETVAKQLGTTRKWVQSRLALTGLPARAREAVRIQAMSIMVAQEVLALDPSEMLEATELLLDFGDDLTGAQARLQLQERYRAPRQRREVWVKRWPSIEEKFGDEASPIEDCETWASYLRPYGEAYGRWVEGSEHIGAAAADEKDAGITWRELSKALGIKGILVPLRGNGDVFLLFDRSKIEAAEKAARENGDGFTLGPRKRGASDPAPAPIGYDWGDDGEDNGYYADPADEVPLAELDEDGLIDRLIEGFQNIDESEVLGVIEDLLRKQPGELRLFMYAIGLRDEVVALINLKRGEAA